MQKFANAKTEQERLDWLDKILFKWTGNENIAKNSRGKFADGQKLGTLEKLYGQDFIDAYKSHNPSYWNIWEELNRQYIVVRDKVYAQLAMQTFDKELFSGVKIVYGQKSGELAIDIAGVQSLIDKQITRSNSTAAGSLKEFFAMITKLGWTKSIGELDGFVEHFEGKTGMVQFYAYSFGKELVEMASDATSVRGDMNAMAILGNALDNDLFASAKDDVLYGGNGNDRMHGGYYGYGDDIFIGGKGDDFMEGGYGADTYIWNKGDGNDTIDTANGFDKREVDIMRFGEGIGRNDVAILQEGDDLVLQYKETGEKVKIKYWFQSNCYWLKEVVFADGTVLSNKELTALAEIHGTSGNDELHGAGFYGCKYHGDAGDDILVGTHRTDSLYGDEGNDRLFSGAGDDVLVGGLGDDYLEGYYGRDTYVWNKGDGNDTIDAYNYSSMSNKDRLLMERINQAMLDFSMSGDDLICTYTPTNEFITVENWGRGDQYKLASIECADGRLLAADINKKIKLG